MRRLLSDAVPLRTTAEFGEYREVRAIPLVYGKVTLTPIPADSSGKEWLLADHAVASVTSVSLDGTAVSGWELRREVIQGRVVSRLIVPQPILTGSLAVQVDGKMNPDTGEVIRHPAAIVLDLLNESGWDVSTSIGDTLHESFPGVVLAGVIRDQNRTLRSVLDEILLPLGVVWSGFPWVAIRDEEGPPVAEVELIDPTAVSRYESIATFLRGTYAYDYAASKPRRAIAVASPDAVQRYGVIEQEWPMPWVQNGRDAEAILLHRMLRISRPEWQVSAQIPFREPFPMVGDTVSLNDVLVPSGNALLTAREIDRSSALCRVNLRLYSGPVTQAKVVSYGQAIDAAAAETLNVMYKDGVATFTILDEAGSPLAGASVTLDSITTRTTDQFGVVQFLTEPGPHTITVVALGFEPFELDIVL